MIITIDPPIDNFYDVATNEAVVTGIGHEFRTGYMATCWALVIKSCEKQLMAHITPFSDYEPLVEVVRDNFVIGSKDWEIYLVPGVLKNGYTEGIIFSVLRILRMEKLAQTRQIYDSLSNQLVLSAHGDLFVEAEKRVSSDNIIVENGKKYRFLKNIPTPNGGGLETNCLQVETNMMPRNAIGGPARPYSKGHTGVYQIRP